MERVRRRMRAGGLALAGLLALAGCHAPAPPPAPPPPAHLVVINASGYRWQLVLTPAAGGRPRTESVPAGAERDLALAGGDYGIDQSAGTADGAPALTRHLTVHLSAGQTYRWQLATLLSAAADPAP